MSPSASPARPCPTPVPARSRVPVLALALALVLILGPGAGAVSAHGAVGNMTVTRAEPTEVGSGEVAVEVGILYADDGHLAEGAIVTANFTGAEGDQVGPVDLPRISGARYGATVALAPGVWSMTVSSETPVAQATAEIVVAAPATPTEPAPPIDGQDAATLEPEPPAAAEATASGGEDGGGGGGGGGGMATVAILAGAALLFGGLAARVVLVRRRGS